MARRRRVSEVEMMAAIIVGGIVVAAYSLKAAAIVLMSGLKIVSIIFGFIYRYSNVLISNFITLIRQGMGGGLYLFRLARHSLGWLVININRLSSSYCLSKGLFFKIFEITDRFPVVVILSYFIGYACDYYMLRDDYVVYVFSLFSAIVFFVQVGKRSGGLYVVDDVIGFVEASGCEPQKSNSLDLSLSVGQQASHYIQPIEGYCRPKNYGFDRLLGKDYSRNLTFIFSEILRDGVFYEKDKHFRLKSDDERRGLFTVQTQGYADRIIKGYIEDLNNIINKITPLVNDLNGSPITFEKYPGNRLSRKSALSIVGAYSEITRIKNEACLVRHSETLDSRFRGLHELLSSTLIAIEEYSCDLHEKVLREIESLGRGIITKEISISLCLPPARLIEDGSIEIAQESGAEPKSNNTKSRLNKILSLNESLIDSYYSNTTYEVGQNSIQKESKYKIKSSLNSDYKRESEAINLDVSDSGVKAMAYAATQPLLNQSKKSPPKIIRNNEPASSNINIGVNLNMAAVRSFEEESNKVSEILHNIFSGELNHDSNHSREQPEVFLGKDCTHINNGNSKISVSCKVDEIRLALKGRKISEVSKATGLSRQALYDIMDGTSSALRKETYHKLVNYLNGDFLEEQIITVTKGMRQLSSHADKSLEKRLNLEINEDISSFVRLILAKGLWTRDELESIAQERSLMLDGVIEQINEASFDVFDQPLIEGEGGGYEINKDLIGKIINGSN